MPDSMRPRSPSGGKVQGHRRTVDGTPAFESSSQTGSPRRRFIALGGVNMFFCSNRFREKSARYDRGSRRMKS